jgi:hypothetical protein
MTLELVQHHVFFCCCDFANLPGQAKSGKTKQQFLLYQQSNQSKEASYRKSNICKHNKYRLHYL